MATCFGNRRWHPICEETFKGRTKRAERNKANMKKSNTKDVDTVFM